MKRIYCYQRAGRSVYCQSFLLCPGQFGFSSYFLLFPIMLLFIAGCISDVELDIPDQEVKHVVEGWIEQDGFPRVIISETMNFNTSHGLADIFDLLITDAQVRIKTGDDEELLSIVQDTMYTVLPIYRGFRIKGEVGKEYTIEVRIDDHIYTSTDVIMPPVEIDSLWFIPEPGKNNRGNVHLSFTDPPQAGNFYRLVAKRVGLDDDFYNVSGNILGDFLFNGKKLQFPLVRSTSNVYDEDDEYFGPGETVVVKICMLTEQRYSYLSSVSSQLGTMLSPISIQSKTVSLMAGGALGGWCCFGVSTDTIRIK
jgi:hypothetical protein